MKSCASIIVNWMEAAYTMRYMDVCGKYRCHNAHYQTTVVEAVLLH